MPPLNRRDFLKLAALLPPAALLAQSARRLSPTNPSLPNILIVLFDAMSAHNLSVYGYPRDTTPSLRRFAERATVYHAHYSSGNYTIPGTSSLLTGLYPWTHRAINNGGAIKRSLAERNIFRLLGEQYQRVGFSQNIWANFILSQFNRDIDLILPPSAFSVADYIVADSFRDQTLAYRGLDDFLFRGNNHGSLVLNPLQKALVARTIAQTATADYPKGLPGDVNYPIKYRLDDLFTSLGDFVQKLGAPYFAYLHLFSPHAPFRPSSEFFGKFDDTFTPTRKPKHRLSDGKPNAELNNARRSYDEYVATVDKEFGKMMDSLEAAGKLENTYVIVMSDHGEMFERGEKNHETVLLYDPVIHIPMLVRAPGQTARQDIYTPTNNVDLLPTLLHFAGQPAPDWCEGQVLPGLGGEASPERATFVMEAKRNSAFAPLRIGTFVIRKGKYKLIYYTGYEAEDSFELYDMEADPEEMTDVYSQEAEIAAALKRELLETIQQRDLV
jgi:arylsulfatase A-like enzyme